jgi:hypothetical protein
MDMAWTRIIGISIANSAAMMITKVWTPETYRQMTQHCFAGDTLKNWNYELKIIPGLFQPNKPVNDIKYVHFILSSWTVEL